MSYEYMTGMGEEQSLAQDGADSWAGDLFGSLRTIGASFGRREQRQTELDRLRAMSQFGGGRIGSRRVGHDASGSCPTGYSSITVPGIGRSMPTFECALNPGADPIPMTIPSTRGVSCPTGGYNQSCSGDSCVCFIREGSAPTSWAAHEAMVRPPPPQLTTTPPSNGQPPNGAPVQQQNGQPAQSFKMWHLLAAGVAGMALIALLKR